MARRQAGHHAKALIFGVACTGDQTVAGAAGRRNASVTE